MTISHTYREGNNAEDILFKQGLTKKSNGSLNVHVNAEIKGILALDKQGVPTGTPGGQHSFYVIIPMT